MKLNREFYLRDTLTIARDLLGKVLVHSTPEGITKGIIVETEAYLGTKDSAAHSYKATKDGRTNIQYGKGGYAYTYLIYGMYTCMNVVTEKEDVPECVLIRALEPIEGISIMNERRKTDKLSNLCSGPGKLCMAMAINKDCYGMDLCGDELYIEDAPPLEESMIIPSKRINIDYAGEAKDYLWRFTIKDNSFVSVKIKQSKIK